MQDLWQRIEKQLRGLGSAGSFGAPASEDSILAAEAVLGVELPEDLRASLAIHNGDAMKKLDGGAWQSDGPFAHMELLSAGAMVSEWEVWQETIGKEGLEPQPEGPVKALWWNPRWIPVTVIAGSTWHHCVDLAPAPGGRIGQVIEIVDDDSWRRVVAPSFRAFLEQIAADLNGGRYAIDDEGRLVHDSWT